MKLHVILLATAVVTSSLVAQNDKNRLRKNNDPWLVVSSAKHPMTGNNYAWPPTVPAAYSAAATTGVVKGTEEIRWIPEEVNMMREARKVIGLVVGIRPSAATTGFPYNGYYPRTRYYHDKNKMGSGGWFGGEQRAPDRTKAPWIDMPQTTQAFAAFGNFLVTKTLTNAVAITQTNMVIGLTFNGGEHRNVPGTAAQPSQNYFNEFSAGIHTPNTVYYADPQGVLTDYNDGNNQNFSVTWATYLYDGQPTMSQGSDWGYRRDARLLPRVSGDSVGTGRSDLGTKAGMLQWRVNAGAMSGGDLTAFLFNFSPTGKVFPISFSILGMKIDLNVADPNLGLLSTIGGAINTTSGEFKTAKIAVPILGPSAIGSAVGVEAILLPRSNRPFRSTEANWFQINR